MLKEQMLSELEIHVHTANYISGDRWWLDRDGRNWWNRKTRFLYNAVYLTRVGEFDLRIGERLLHIPPRSLVFIPAGSDLEYSFDGKGQLEKYYVHFDLSLGKEMLSRYFEIPLVTVPKDFQAIEATFLALNRAYSEGIDPISQIAVRGHLLTLISELLRESGATLSEARGQIPEDMREIATYVEAHIGKNPSVESLAERVGYSTAHFGKRFKSAFGVTPSEYMNCIRIERACLLLRTTDLSVSLIAEELGFCDASYFSNFFRNKTGLSPNFYRKKNGTV